MGIYIEDMEMPADGCHHIICIYADGTVATGRREYRAVPVPPHGDLIDRDMTRGSIKPWSPEDERNACTFDTVKKLMYTMLDRAPTIIPADGPDMDSFIHIFEEDDELVKRLRNGLPCYGEKCLSCPDRKHCVTHYENEAADAIEKLSKERKRGKWTLHKDGSGTCSECHFRQANIWDLDNWQNFCGHCGADMREPPKEETSNERQLSQKAVSS